MSSNYQQKKMMNALGAIDTKGNIVLEQFQDGTALLFQPGNAQPFCVATESRHLKTVLMHNIRQMSVVAFSTVHVKYLTTVISTNIK